MPINKGDIVLFYIPHEYADTVGLLGSDFHLSRKSKENEAEVMIAYFIEYDDFGGVWMKAINPKQDIEETELMIPHDMIMSMFTNPKKIIEKQIGFKIPDNIKKILDKL